MSTNPLPIQLTENLSLLHDAANATINVTTASPSTLSHPFPHQQIDLADISVSVQGGNTLTFNGAGTNTVGFNLSAGANAGAGVFLDGTAIATALGLDDNIALNMPSNPAQHYTMLRSGFDFNASVNGAVALGGAGSASLGLTGAADAQFGVVRLFPDGAQTGIAELTAVANSWRLPVHIKTDADLHPGEWLISDVGGSIGLTIGAQYGLDYNFIRNLKLGSLAGDVGLRLQLGINATLGLNASGTYEMVVSRESLDPTSRIVHLRLFRNAQRGWNVALNAGAVAQIDTSILPDNVDDFIAAVFGVQGAQVINDLHVVESWTGDTSTLSGLLSSAGIDRAFKLLTQVTGFDAQAEFQKAHGIFDKFLQAWDNLPHSVSSLLLKFVSSKVDVTPIQNIANLIANGSQNDFTTALATQLQNVAFFQTPLGQYLESIASQGVVSLLNAPDFAGLQKVASATLGLLDGSTVQTLLQNLQNEIVTALNLQPLVDLAGKIDQATFDSLDQLLKAKLAAFLDKSIADLGLQDVDNIRKAIGMLLGRRNTIYAEVKKALDHKYRINLAATYQSQTTKTALIDVSFDFAKGDQATLSALLQQAIGGQFNQLLTQTVNGVSIAAATLTHGLKRQAHVEFNMPYFSSTFDQLLTSDASVSPVDAQNGRMLMYDLRAQSVTEARIKGSLFRNSTLTVAANFGVQAGTGVRVHQTIPLTYAYDFRQGMKKITSSDFASQVGAYLDSYFSANFAATGGTKKAWTSLLESKAGGGSTLANSLMTVELSTSATAGDAWFTATDENEPTRIVRLRRALLASLQNIIPFYYFSDLSKFSEVGFAGASLLVYQACAPLEQLGNITSDAVLAAIANQTIAGDDDSPLGQVLDYWSARLTAAGGPNTEFFRNNAINRQKIVQITTSQLANLRSLLITSASVLSAAVKARKDVVAFLAQAPAQPTQAIQHLSDFGAALATAFGNITSIYGGDGLRPLATLAYLDAARALSGAEGTVDALLDVTFLQSGVDPLTFSDGSMPTAAQILAEDGLVAAKVIPGSALPAGVPPNPRAAAVGAGSPLHP